MANKHKYGPPSQHRDVTLAYRKASPLSSISQHCTFRPGAATETPQTDFFTSMKKM